VAQTGLWRPDNGGLHFITISTASQWPSLLDASHTNGLTANETSNSPHASGHARRTFRGFSIRQPPQRYDEEMDCIPAFVRVSKDQSTSQTQDDMSTSILADECGILEVVFDRIGVFLAVVQGIFGLSEHDIWRYECVQKGLWWFQ
jgi:hypothetical protein